MSRVIVTYVYAHNNQEDALRFRDQVHEILRGNKRYISNEIRLVSQQKPVIKDSVLPSEEDGNLILQINGNLYYHCVKIVFIYKIKNQHQLQQPIISLFYKCGDRFHADNPPKSYTSQTDLIVLHKIAKLYYEEFESGQLDENIIIGPQVGVFPSRRFSTSDVMNTVVDQENLNTKGSSMTPRHPHIEPAMISWVDKLDSLMSKDDPDYDRFQKFKELWKEIIVTGIATKNLRLNSDIFAGRKKFFKQTIDDFDWLKNLPDPNDSDGDIPNIKGLKDLLDDIVQYTLAWAKTGVEDIDDRMIKVGTYASTCKSILEGKSALLEIALRCTCPKCKEDIVVNPYYKEKKPIEKDDRLQTFIVPNCGTCNFKENILIINRLKDKLDEVSSDISQLENNKDNLTLGEMRRYESNIQNGVDYCKNLIWRIVHMTDSKDKEEDIVDNTVQINELKHRLRTLPDPRYLPNAKYTRKLIDELDDLLNGSNVIKAKDNTYILNADTFYNAVAKLSAIRNAVSKPGMWVDSQTSAWIHTNKDYETLKVLKTYLECEAKKYVNYPACIIETDMMNHMINLIEDALNLYAVDPK